ncbi:MAG: tRNA guanosine(34) transglycosylase Tgt [Chitinophagaceae bacterium]|jgi:queuine tRNA-ribosyltransferase|nr:tRNA guanosine(34) transglycosylase Tgt [Chitinophagaceae bacterium]
MAALQFNLAYQSKTGASRAGTITTDHGEIQTPIFMPVGTIGSVKAVTQQQLKNDIHAQIILGNTYHLYLRPGTEVMEAAGGLHRFMGWDRPILTDSGGYQVFSLASNRKIKPEGVLFQSHIDGSKHLFSPEKVMDIQRSIGADIIMAFDECPPYPSEYEYVQKSMNLTHLWLDKCFNRLAETPDLYGHTQNLFPIVQGGTYADLRKASCEYISSKNAVGNAIGGLSVGESEQELYDFTQLCCENLPVNKPRYLMGVGTPWNILEAIDLGVDMFDCVMPTRNGRNGMVFTSQGVINIKNKQWASDFSPLDPGIPNELSQYYTKAYMRHLFMADEILGLQLASIQNLSFYLWLVGQAREHIIAGDYTSWKKTMVAQISKRL